MTEQERIAKVVAHALWAIRVYLGTGYGEEYPEKVRIAARLAYALHNDALAITNDDFKFTNLEDILSKIERIDTDLGSHLLPQFQEVLETR